MQTDGGLAFVTILDMVALEQKFGGAIGSHYLQSLLFSLTVADLSSRKSGMPSRPGISPEC